MEAIIKNRKNDEPQQQNFDHELVDDAEANEQCIAQLYTAKRNIMLQHLSDYRPQKFIQVHELYKRECQNNNKKVSTKPMSIEIVRFMVQNKICLNSRVNAKWQTPLHLAFELQDLECVMFLLNHDADVNAMCSYRCIPLSYYTKFSDSDLELTVLKYIFQRATTLTESDITGEMQAARLLQRGKTKALLALFETNFDLSIKDDTKRSSLHYLAMNPAMLNNQDIINVLRDKSLDIHATDFYHRNTLFYAAKHGSLKLIQFLLDRKAKVNQCDYYGFTPLLSLSKESITHKTKKYRKNYYNCAKLLLQYGADPQEYPTTEETIFDYILQGNDFTLAKLIITRLVILEARSVPIVSHVRDKINSHHLLSYQYNLCKLQLAQLKKIEIPEFTTLYQFLCESDEKKVRYLQNTEFYASFKDISAKFGNKSEFLNICWSLMEISIKKIELKRKAADLICEVMRLCYNGHRVIVDKTLQHLTDADLEKFEI